MLNDIKKSILSGLMITVGGSVYMACRTINCGSPDSPFYLTWLGAILFSAGLFTICVYGFNLYTGKVGYIAYKFKDFSYIRLVVLIVIFNLLSTFLLGIVIAYAFPGTAAEAFRVYAPKFFKIANAECVCRPLLQLFISASFCGLLMFLAVDTWKKEKPIGCFLFVAAFIFAGFDHSIANSFYNGAAFGHQLFAAIPEDDSAKELFVNFKEFSLPNLYLTLVAVLGNAFGGMVVPLLTRSWKEEKSE